MSDKVHVEGDGDYEYDHEAFLGEDDAEYFDSLTPEESQRRLGVICDRIDLDKDGFINQEELRRFVVSLSKHNIVYLYLSGQIFSRILQH